MTTPLGDLPDWTTQTAPLVRSSSEVNMGAGLVLPLLTGTEKFRVWGAWISVSVASDTSFGTGSPQTWGAQIGDSIGGALVRAQVHIANNNQVNQQHVNIAIPGFTPLLSSGDYTINFITDVGITHLFTRASGGILYSIP
jgi:hypothetical protein